MTLIDPQHPELSIRKQCELLEVARSRYYYEPVPMDEESLTLMNLIDEQYTRTPYYGSRRLTAWLRRKGYEVNLKRVKRLMRLMGIRAIYPEPHTSQGNEGHKVYPYLLEGVIIDRPNQVWSTDITYVRLANGFLYLVAVLDWHSRYVLAWRLSNTLDVTFCLESLEDALTKGRPDIFNMDQGSQFTSLEYTGALARQGIGISMDGKGRALDNIFVERLWRTVKYEEIYLKHYETVPEVYEGLTNYFRFYNEERLHQSLGYRTPAEVHYDREEKGVVPKKEKVLCLA